MKFLLFLFIVAGIVCMGAGSVKVYQGLNSKNWTPVEATMLKSEVDSHLRKKKRRYRVKVLYQYEWEGKAYQSEQLSLGGYGLGRSRHAAEEVRDEFPKGKAVTAYVKQGDPESAVLKPGTSFGACLVPLLGLLFAGVSFWLSSTAKSKQTNG